VHFCNGKPTDDHPYPELFLGNTESIVIGRAKNKKMKISALQSGKNLEMGGVGGVAEFVDFCSKT